MTERDDLTETTTASVNVLLERIEAGVDTDADRSSLRQILLAEPQRLTQLGKYNIHIGEGKDFHIGDRSYVEINEAAIQAIVEAIQQSVKAVAPQVQQTVSGNQNQVIAQMTGGTAIANVETLILHQPAPQTAPPLETFFGVPYARNPFFTGREEILTILKQQLNQNGTVVINQVQAISGLGGIGKTQTAVEYAYRCYGSSPRLYDWVLWVRADTVVNLTSDFAGLAIQLQLPAAQLKPEEQIPVVKQWLASHDRWLLIFDNADNPTWLEPFLPNHSQGQVLLTSRASVFDLVGIVSPLTLNALTDQEAVNFLFQRVSRDRTAPEELAAAELAQELGNLPLALEQAGAFILRQKLSFQTYLTTYRKHCLQQLEKVKPQTGKYPASVLTTWSLNFQAVEAGNAASAELLRLSAVLAPNPIPYHLLLQGASHLEEPLAAALQAENADDAVMAVAELLEPLSQYSLVQWEPEQAQYSIHRMVQAVVREGMTEETRQRWVTRAVSALDAAYPVVEFQNWAVCAQLLPHALKVIELAKPQEHEVEAFDKLINQTAYYLQNQGRYADAEPLYRNALQLRRELFGDRHPDVAQSLNNLAALYYSQGRYIDAEPLHQEALQLRRELFGDRHPDVAQSLNNLAALYYSQERYTDAEPLYQEAFQLYREILGYQHPDVAQSLNNLALLYYSQGRYTEAEPLYRDALQLYRELLGDRHPLVASSLNNLAILYKSQGRFEVAEPLYRDALQLRRELLGDQHPRVATSLNNLAELYRAQGRYTDAEPLYVQALEIMASSLGENHPDTQTVWWNLVGFLQTAVDAQQTDRLSDHPLVQNLLRQMPPS